MTGPRLSRCEYWLLDTVVEEHALLHHTWGDEEGLCGFWNKPGHGVDRAALVGSFWKLHERGYVVFRHDVRGWVEPADRREIDGWIDDSPFQKLDGPPARPGCCYELTAEGGAAWEAFARPQWDRYLKEEYYPDDGRAVIWSLSRSGLRIFCAHLDKTGLPTETVEINPSGPWAATYWKSFPSGFVARFAYQEKYHVSDELAFLKLDTMRRGWVRWR